ncbi:MAG: undecaprenyl-phosphate glucose phosphotransferase [Methylothermaceae bacteria B42]|nr:MAG: undecaprenyl-phosphate glucose phosphotransferase [Methylothermaceae bacteria B42]HHJ37909.1 undecaprenyl-phosphate glucose phosphotransferase [Methylothermaceae bacterium]
MKLGTKSKISHNLQSGVIRPYSGKLQAVVKLLDDASVVLAMYLALKLFSYPFDIQYLYVAIAGIVLYRFFAEYFEVYHTWRGEYFYSEARRIAYAWFSAVAVLVVVLFLLKRTEPLSRLAIGLWTVNTFLLFLALHGGRRVIASALRMQGRNTRTLAIVGANDIGLRLERTIRNMPWLGYRFLGYYEDRKAVPDRRRIDGVHVVGTLEGLYRDAKAGRVDHVYIVLPLSAENRIRAIIDELADSTVSVFFVPNFFVFNLIQARWNTLQGIPVVSVYDTPYDSVDVLLKRLEDLILGSIFLAITAIPMLFIAIGVKLTSPGPILFKQRRYGFNGEEIEVWKFRSMRVCEDGDRVIQAKRNDSRITPFGAFLRRTSLDELPQFINVLQGTMSIVGPRPHAVAHNEYYRKLIPGYMLRHKVKPGITGLAQINGFRGETETLEKMKERIKYDLDYIRHWSLWLDFKIIFLTAVTVIKGCIRGEVY